MHDCKDAEPKKSVPKGTIKYVFSHLIFRECNIVVWETIAKVLSNNAINIVALVM